MTHNKRMQRTRTDHILVLGSAHRRVADAQRWMGRQALSGIRNRARLALGGPTGNLDNLLG